MQARQLRYRSFCYQCLQRAVKLLARSLVELLQCRLQSASAMKWMWRWAKRLVNSSCRISQRLSNICIMTSMKSGKRNTCQLDIYCDRILVKIRNSAKHSKACFLDSQRDLHSDVRNYYVFRLEWHEFFSITLHFK
jgi:hypothetical protein